MAHLAALAEELVPAEHRGSLFVRYYTARVSGRRDPTEPLRQKIYLDAVATERRVSVHFGSFLTSLRWAEIKQPPETRPVGTTIPAPHPELIRIRVTEEKGSDVNLGSHLLRDGFRGAYGYAWVLSNDTDLIEPIRIVREELGLPVGLLTPVPKPAPPLAALATSVRHIHNGHLARAQFPDRIPGTKLKRPANWVARSSEASDANEDAVPTA